MAQGTADMLSPHLECLLHTLPAPLLWPLPVRFSVWGSLSLLTDPPPRPRRLAWMSSYVRLVYTVTEDRDCIFSLVSMVSSTVLIHSLGLINVRPINE